jgi:molybdenum cofactor cytidylyltransferase
MPHRLDFGVIILAAGASSRMGEPKMLLPWGKTSVLGQLLLQWRNAGAAQIAVVLAPGNEGLRRELDRLGFEVENRIINPAPERGMFSSIQCAAQWPDWLETLTHFVIALGDQPHLQAGTLASLLDLAARHPRKICQLTRHGRPRHPVLLPRTDFQRLGESAHETLKQFLQSSPAELIVQESDDAGLDLDLDTPADYEKALKLFRA